MSHGKHGHERISRGPGPASGGAFPAGFGIPDVGKSGLEIVLKCDSKGSLEAISAVLFKLKLPGVELKLIHTGVGAITKQDMLMALSGSKLVLGFQVGVAPRVEQWIKERGVEVRLYDVIYKLLDDIREIAGNLTPPETEETVTGKCKVIAVFKSSKGVVLGCEVQEGTLQIGKNFRIVAAMGAVYGSRIESLQVEKKPVKEARHGQQVGVKVGSYGGAKIGDYIECFETTTPKKTSWSPEGRVIHLEAH